MHNIDYSIVCCFYNEKQILKKKFNGFLDKTKNSPFSYEVLICDNHSNDGTYEFLKEIESSSPKNFRFIFNSTNLGKGGSIKKCATFSKGKYIVIYDMDEYVYEDLIIADSLLKKNGDIDFLIGSRALEGKNYIYKKNYYGVRFLSILINLLFKTNITDAAAAIKFFRKEIYDKLKVETCGFDFEIDLLCKYAMRKHNIAEFPVQYFPRTYEQGKKVRAFKDGLTILRTILKNFLSEK